MKAQVLPFQTGLGKQKEIALKKAKREASQATISPFFDMQARPRRLIKPRDAAKLLGVSVSTIYDWKYRSKRKSIPDELFVKINRMLYLRIDVLDSWLRSQNNIER